MTLKRIITILFAALTLAFVSLTNLHAQPPKYNVTFLPRLPSGYRLFATNLNNLGDVIGSYFAYKPHGFLYSNGTIIDIGTLGGSTSSALGINDLGHVVGFADTSTGSTHAFLYADGVMTDLNSLAGEQGWSSANAINNAGQIVGQSDISTAIYERHAVIFWQGQIIDMGVLGSPGGLNVSSAFDINDSYDTTGLGEIVGYSTYIPTNSSFPAGAEAFVYSDATMTGLGSAICPSSVIIQAFRINNSDQILLYCDPLTYLYDSQESKYFLIGNSLYDDIPQIDINDAGQIIGTNTASNGTILYPFLFMNGVEYNLYDLITPGVTLTDLTPAAINNKGQIAATAYEGVVLLNPIN